MHSKLKFLIPFGKRKDEEGCYLYTHAQKG